MSITPKAVADRSSSAWLVEGFIRNGGKPAQELRPGDVVNIPAGVKHWHGASPDSWFSHLAVEVPGEETSNEWLEPVDDEEYLKATNKQA